MNVIVTETPWFDDRSSIVHDGVVLVIDSHATWIV